MDCRGVSPNTCASGRDGSLNSRLYCIQTFEAKLPEASRKGVSLTKRGQLGGRLKHTQMAWVLFCFVFSLGLRYFCESLPLILSKDKKIKYSSSLGIMQTERQIFSLMSYFFPTSSPVSSVRWIKVKFMSPGRGGKRR